MPFDDGEVEAEIRAGMQSMLFWNSPGIRMVYFERSMVACLRFQYRGSAELLIWPPESLKAEVFN